MKIFMITNQTIPRDSIYLIKDKISIKCSNKNMNFTNQDPKYLKFKDK